MELLTFWICWLTLPSSSENIGSFTFLCGWLHVVSDTCGSVVSAGCCVLHSVMEVRPLQKVQRLFLRPWENCSLMFPWNKIPWLFKMAQLEIFFITFSKTSPLFFPCDQLSLNNALANSLRLYILLPGVRSLLDPSLGRADDFLSKLVLLYRLCH